MGSIIKKLDAIHDNHNWIFTVGSWLVYGGVTLILTFCSLKDIPSDIKDIKKNVSTLNSNLKNTTAGGIPIVVGVNPRELKENIAYVFAENKHNLQPGDRVYLTNFTDNTYQATIIIMVQKKINKSINENTAADLFISDDAAMKLGFKDYKKSGVIELKFQHVEPEKRKEQKNTQS
jgi:hypothetical protein